MTRRLAFQNPLTTSTRTLKFQSPYRTVELDFSNRKMHSYVQVLTTPTADTTGTAVILDVGKRRYLIGNIHEGLSRACTQRNARMAKISEIFISGRTEWRNTGGLIGCILTLADANASSLEAEREKLRLQKTKEAAKQSNAKFQANQLRKAAAFQKAGLDLQEYQSFTEEQQSESPEMPTVNVHGAQNLTHALATARRFVFRKGMPVTVEEHVPGPLVDVAQDRDPDWTDDFIQVWKLPIEPSDRDRVSPNSLETPRKRSFDDYSREDEPLSEHDQNSKESPLNTKEGPDDQEIRRFVVKEMFNSAWRSNELTETPFKDVQLPAAVWIRNRGTGKLERYLYRDGEPPPDINVFVRKPWPGSQVERLPQAQPSRIAMSYIFRHFRQKGKFNAQKANELNVDKLVWSVLQSGISVLSNDKTTVTPEMVLEPSVEGGGFAVVDLPSNEYVQVLTQRPEWKASRIIDGLQACIWILGPNVIQNEELREFITHHSNLKHIISSPDISPNYLSFDSSSALLVRLNQIDAQRYSIPIYDNVAPLGPVMSIPDELSTSNILGARRDLQVQLQPKLEIQKAATATPFLDISHVAGETPEEVLQLANIANEEISLGKAKESQSEQNLPSPDAQVICLGTGSSAPSKHRNVSATLLRIPNCGSYMFDCGEGTVGQLKRLYSPQKINEVLTDLKAIWISHLHADHHLGIASLIIAWREMNLGRGQGSAPSNEGRDGNVFSQNKKLFIFSGSGITEWLQEYAEIEEGLLDNVVLVYCNRSQKDTEKCGSVAKIIWDQRQVHSDHPDFASM